MLSVAARRAIGGLDLLVGATYAALAVTILIYTPETGFEREPEDMWIAIILLSVCVFFSICGSFVGLRLLSLQPIQSGSTLLVYMNGAATLLHMLLVAAAIFSPLDRIMLLIILPAAVAFAISHYTLLSPDRTVTQPTL